MPIDSADPRKPARVSGKWPAVTLAIAVHVVFIAVLVFSVRWQNRKPEPVMAELYAPPMRTPAAETPAPPPVAKPTPPPKPQPAPEPEPKIEPRPVPKPVIKPPPPIEKPDPRAAEIALKAKQEEERRKREQADLERKEAEKKDAERKDAERRETERKRQEEQKRVAEVRERQSRESEALKAQAERETQLRTQQQAERDAQIRAQAERDAQLRAQQQLAAANKRALDEYVERIKTKVRGNVIEPGEIAGNPQAEFEVVQLPTGDIIDVTLRKSSGVRAYDDAVERAIRKSSPLPRPTQPGVWSRELKLTFRPRE